MESTLAEQLKDLQADIGFFIGYGRGANFSETAWTTAQQNDIDRSTKGGLRKFYHCGYPWSFLKPMATLSLASAAQVVAMPDDFGGLEGQVTVSVSGGGFFAPLPVGGVGELYQRFAEQPTTTGRPLVCCVEPLKGTGPTQGQRQQLHVWPIADQAYTIQLQYYLDPDYLTNALPYPYGGAEHAETRLEACLSVAEKILDDAATVHDFEFKALLAVSQDIDRRKKPQMLGCNRDRSDAWGDDRRDWRNWSPVTVNGVSH